MSVEGKNILITGGAGFIGSHLAEEYLRHGAGKILIFDDFSTGFRENLDAKDDRIRIVEGSILNEKLVEQTIQKEKVQIVDHEAAELEVYTGILNAQKDAQANILGTLNVLNSAMRNNVEKVLFASSGAVYGEPQYLPVDESHPLVPHWPYGVSKLSAERYCIQYHRLYGLNTTAFRYSIVYGPREWFGRVLTMFIKKIFLERKPPIIFGDGSQLRDFVFIGDLVRAHVPAIQNPRTAGETFNLSSRKGVTVRELAEMLIELSGHKLEAIFDDPQEGKASTLQPERIRLKGELRRFVLDNKRAERILGWKPTTQFKEGVLKEIDWATRNTTRWSGSPRV